MSKEIHKVKSHIWRDGILTVFEEYFESFEEALHYSRSVPSQAVKIYSGSGDLVHSTSSLAAPTTAEHSYA